MELVRVGTAREFLDATEQLRARSPVATNVLGSVALSVADGVQQYDEQFWWVARDRDEVVGLAMRTPPHGLLFGPSDRGVAAALARAVAVVDPEFPSVNGPADEVDEFLSELRQLGGGRRSTLVQRELVQEIHELHELHQPKVSGVARLATANDTALVTAWGQQFAVDAHIAVWSDESLLKGIDRQSLYLWTDDDEPVSMASHAVPVTSASVTVARVGPVFTPHDRRGRGYGAAVTAEVTGELMRRGYRVMLHTDAANATSNGVYQRLGYRVEGELVRYELRAPLDQGF